MTAWAEIGRVDGAPPEPEPPALPVGTPRPLDTPLRRPLASSDPDVLRPYERLVVAREGLRDMVHAVLAELGAGDASDDSQLVSWYRAAALAIYHVDRAQQLLEKVK